MVNIVNIPPQPPPPPPPLPPFGPIPSPPRFFTKKKQKNPPLPPPLPNFDSISKSSRFFTSKTQKNPPLPPPLPNFDSISKSSRFFTSKTKKNPPLPPPLPNFDSISKSSQFFTSKSDKTPISSSQLPKFKSIPRSTTGFFTSKTDKNQISSSQLPKSESISRSTKRKSQSPPLPPPPPPAPPQFGPILPKKFKKRKRSQPQALINKDIKEMLVWYLLTLKIGEKIESLNQPVQSQTGPGLNPQRDEWVISIREQMDQARRDNATSIWGKLCIYRIPHYLQEKDNKSYSPQTVSLGPYHYGKEHLRLMDRHKWRAIDMILNRTNQGIELYFDAMKELEEKARACYEGRIGLDSNEFVQMLVLDGCFVLELFNGVDKGFLELGYAPNDPVFAMRGSMHSIQRDMVMLENQLPLFILNRLLELQLGTDNQPGLVAKLAVRFFDPLMPTDESLTKSVSKIEDLMEKDKFFNPIGDKEKGELHCLDVFRRSLLRFSSKPEPRLSRKRWSWKARVADKRQQQLIHCVTELREAGIRFRVRKTDRFWDIRFKNGFLEIPRLLIHDGTKSLFSNLIAFEQCHIDSSNDITSYIIFMDNLIDSPEDVSYLHYCGIIEHWLGSDYEVAELFNRLCREVAFDPQNSYLSQLSVNINRNYNHKWNKLKAILKHKYFNNPWAYFSFVAALFLLILTLFQSFFSAYAYFKPLKI